MRLPNLGTSFTTSPRFKRFGDVQDGRGATVRVYESSAADAPHIWLAVEAECFLDEPPRPFVDLPHGLAKGEAHAHLSIEAAEQVIAELRAAIENHYQLPSSPTSGEAQ